MLFCIITILPTKSNPESPFFYERYHHCHVQGLSITVLFYCSLVIPTITLPVATQADTHPIIHTDTHLSTARLTPVVMVMVTPTKIISVNNIIMVVEYKGVTWKQK